MVRAISIVFIVVMAGVITSTAGDLGRHQSDGGFNVKKYNVLLNTVSGRIPVDERTCGQKENQAGFTCRERNDCPDKTILTVPDNYLMQRMIYCNSVEDLEKVDSIDAFSSKTVCC